MKKILLSTLILISLFSCQNEKTEHLSDTDYNLELIGYQTPNVNLSNLKGNVIFINFWGSWCPPCRAEMPSIQSLYDKYGDKVKFVLISMEEPAEDYQSFLNKEKLSIPAYQVASVISTKIKPLSFPTTIIVDKEGNIALKRGTARDWDQEDIHRLLNNLLK